MPTLLKEACSVCGSAVCLHCSPDYCRTTNRYRPVKTESTPIKTETVNTPKKVTPKQMPHKKGGKS